MASAMLVPLCREDQGSGFMCLETSGQAVAIKCEGDELNGGL